MTGPATSRIEALALWRSPNLRIRELAGGLSNISFLVEDGSERFVVRCGEDIPAHHVFREHERDVSLAAHAAGLSPELVHAEPGLMVFRFVEGRTWTEADMRAGIGPLGALLRRCHRDMGPRVRGPGRFFWVFHVLRDYAATLARGGSPFLTVVERIMPLVDRLEARQPPMPVVFGHHDLLPGNVIDDGARLWLIDWEYGAFGTPLFDLANASTNASYATAQDEELLATYFGGPPDGAVVAAFDAMKVASTLREAVWAMVSDLHLRRPGADYHAHAAEYLSRTDAALERFRYRHGEP
ncbi:MAG: choline/ethanolamine kinase family protein [Alsobacter sp.]